MDEKLIAWARAVKARRARMRPEVPPLWVFTDEVRLPDPRAVLAALPRGLCGVVLRFRGAPDLRLVAGIARVCRQRRFALVVPGHSGLAAHLRAGRHHSRGAQANAGGGYGLVTASAHGWRELVRARRLAADAVFLSPMFATASHPGAPALGLTRWAALAHRQSGPVLALGGITGARARQLPRFCAGVGVVGAAGGLAFGMAAG